MNEKKEKNQLTEIFFIIVYALIATAILASIILLINCFWPKQNLFKAETWGTISDWFTYLVTLIGGVFIYKTLESQMEVQKSQAVITRIETNKHLYSIKPNIKVKTVFLNEEYNENLDDNILNLILEVSSDKPMTYKMELESEYLLEHSKPMNAKFQHPTANSTSPQYIVVSSSIANRKSSLSIELKYEDIEGNKYKYMKELFILYRNDEYEFKSAIHYDELE